MTNCSPPATCRERSCSSRTSNATIPDAWDQETGGVALEPPATTPRSIRVLVKSNKRLIHPPIVTKALITIEKGKKASTAYVSASGRRRMTRTFARTSGRSASPEWTRAASCPSSAASDLAASCGTPSRQPRCPWILGTLGDAWRYEWFWEDINKAMADTIDRLCTPVRHLRHKPVVRRRSWASKHTAGAAFRLSSDFWATPADTRRR